MLFSYIRAIKLLFMTKHLNSFFTLTTVLLLSLSSCSLSDYTILTGSYTSGNSEAKGINVYRLNAKTLESQLYSETRLDNPSYFTFTTDKKYLYAISENDTNSFAYAFSFDENAYRLAPLGEKVEVGTDPCYVTVHPTNPVLVTADYTSGTVSFIRVSSETHELMYNYSTCTPTGRGIDTIRQNAPHVHCVNFTPDGVHLFATDLGKDAIYSFIDPSGLPEQIQVRDTVPFAAIPQGPRHLIFTKDSKKAYLINELSGDVMVYDQADGKLSRIQIIEADSEHAHGSADIRLSPDEKFLYVSNRLVNDGIVTFKVNSKDGTLTRIAFTPTEKHPRNFRISPDGKLLLVACKDSDCIQIFRRNTKTGELTDSGKRILIDSPACVDFR